MSEFVAVKVRIYPNAKQKELLAMTFGHCRKIYNTALSKRIKLYKEEGRSTNAMFYIYQLPKLKKKFPWLAEVDSQALQQALRDMDVAYKNFFEGRAKYPKFKNKHAKQSFRSSQSNWIKDGRLKIGTSGIFKIRGLNNRYNGERIRNVTVTKDTSDRYFASVLIEKDNTVLDHCHEFLKCGIDVGVAVPLSIGWEDNSGSLRSKQTGRAFSKMLRLKENRRKRYQRVMSRRKLGSQNWKKAKKHVAKARAKETDFRKNWVFNQANYLATTFTEIKFENLNIINMTKGVKKNEDGTARKGVSAKAGLNREILRLGWNLLHIRLSQKAEQYGAKVLFVNPKYTSQRCHECGHTEKANRMSQAIFKCKQCGYRENADINASWNIMDAVPVA